MVAAAPEDVLFVLYHSALKPVQERLRNHFQKYVLTVQEITPEEWATIEPKPGTPKYAKARDEFISEILNRKPKKPVEEEGPTSAAPGPGTYRTGGLGSAGRRPAAPRAPGGARTR